MESTPPPDEFPEPPTNDGGLLGLVIAGVALFALASILAITGVIGP